MFRRPKLFNLYHSKLFTRKISDFGAAFGSGFGSGLGSDAAGLFGSTVKKVIQFGKTRLIFTDSESLKYDDIDDKETQYDFIFKLNTLRQLASEGVDIVTKDPEKYFPDSVNEQDDNAVLDKISLEGAVVGISGYYNRGKTWFINQLANTGFKSERTSHTEGLSFVCPTLEDYKNRFILLDTAGMGSTIKVGKEEDMIDKISTESLLKNIIFDLSDYHIIVLEELTWPDQKHILATKKAIDESNKKIKQLYVVHNLHNITSYEEGKEIFKKRVQDIFKNGKEIKHKISERSQRILGFGNADNPIYKKYYSYDGIRHFWLMNGDCEEGRIHNQRMLEVIRQILVSHTSETLKFNIFRQVTESLQKHLPNYMDINPTEFEALCYIPDYPHEKNKKATVILFDVFSSKKLKKMIIVLDCPACEISHDDIAIEQHATENSSKYTYHILIKGKRKKHKIYGLDFSKKEGTRQFDEWKLVIPLDQECEISTSFVKVHKIKDGTVEIIIPHRKTNGRASFSDKEPDYTKDI